MNIIPTHDGYDIELPEIQFIYTHMLRIDCPLAGVEHANSMIKILKEYAKKNYNLIFTFHYILEDI